MFDPERNTDQLREAFGRAGGRMAIHQNYRHAIPHDREPEISRVARRMEHIHAAFQHLVEARDIIVVPENIDDGPRGTNRLLSLALDTVNQQGKATQRLHFNHFGLRRRCSVVTENGGVTFNNHDFSAKTDPKGVDRLEFEAPTDDLSEGYERLVDWNPAIPLLFRRLDPASFRVPSLCLATRGMGTILHVMREHDAIVAHDICFDACLFANESASVITGDRYELESEASDIFARGIKPGDFDAQHDILNASLEFINSRLDTLPGKLLSMTNESKVTQSRRMAGEHYMMTLKDIGSVDHGVAHALERNIKAEYFETIPMFRTNILRLCEFLPKQVDILPGAPEVNRAYVDQSRFNRHIGSGITIMPA